jgi:ABC-type bacteriocin transporter
MINNFEVVRQEDLTDCGACCLKMIIKYYGGDYPLFHLKQLTHTDQFGTNAFLIKEAALKLGLNAKVVNGNLEDIKEEDLPIIAHVIPNKSYEHFIVIYKLDKKHALVTIADPALGKRVITYGDFFEISSSNFIFFDANKKLAKITSSKRINNLVIETFTNNKKIFVYIILFSVIFIFLNICSSYAFKFLIDNVYLYSNIDNLVFFFIVFNFINVFKNIFQYIRINMINYFNFKLDKILITKLFNHLIYLPFLYYKNKSSSDVINRINDLINVKNNLTKIFLSIVIDGLLAFSILIVLFKINFLLTILSLFLVLIYLFIIVITSPIYNYYIEEEKVKGSEVNSFLHSNLRNMDSIKNLNIEDYVSNKFVNLYEKFYFVNKKNTKFSNKVMFIKNMVHDIYFIFLYYIASKLIISDKFNLALFITYISLLSYFIDPIKNIIDLNFDIKNLNLSLKRVNELFDIKKEEFLVDEKYQKNVVKGDIEFKNITYSYNGYQNILKEFSLKIKENSRVLISGETGSGKSTIARILMNYFAPDKGEVLINNKSISSYNLINIRKDITYISQNETIYKDSLYNNIVLNESIIYDEFLNICKICKVDEIVNKHKFKYDMNLEEDGFGLSGGEKSRIFLARALIKKSSIYIFDETLSNIDVEKEKEILKNVFDNFKTSTFIVITHRLVNKKLFNKVYDLNEVNYV